MIIGCAIIACVKVGARGAVGSGSQDVGAIVLAHLNVFPPL